MVWRVPCCPALLHTKARAQDLSDSSANAEKTEQGTKLNAQAALCFSGTENFFLNSVWQLIQTSCTLKLHGQKDNCLLALYNSCYSMLVWGQSGYRIWCAQRCKYFICTGCFNLNLHSDIYVSSELCPMSLASSAVILSYWKAAQHNSLHHILYHYLIFYKEIFTVQ